MNDFLVDCLDNFWMIFWLLDNVLEFLRQFYELYFWQYVRCFGEIWTLFKALRSKYILVLILFLTSLPSFSINQVNEIILLQRPWISTMEVIFYLGGTQHYRKIGRSRKVLLLVYGCSVLIQRAFWSGMIEQCCILIVFGPIKITGCFCFCFCLVKKLLCLEGKKEIIFFSFLFLLFFLFENSFFY